jgi:hypothetical protein
MTAVANSVFYVDSAIDIKMMAYPILDVDNNTSG